MKPLVRFHIYRGHGRIVALDPTRVESVDEEADSAFTRVHMRNGEVYAVAHTISDVIKTVELARG